MPTTRKIQGYGWTPDLPDHRDHFLSVQAATALPTKVDLRSSMPPVYDQGQLGSCTGNAIAAAYEYEAIKQGEKPDTPSRLFIYYNERVIEGTVDQDAGAAIRDGIKSVHNQGVAPETLWPYDINKFADKPPQEAYSEALNHEAISYARCLPSHIRQALARKTPVVFGFTVYDGFESAQVARTGVLHLPGAEERVVGGHAVLAVGYNDTTQSIIVRNSWGEHWGAKGYFTMPYAYILNPGLASDFWTISRVT